MATLLVSTYESGFQSLGTAVAAAHLLENGNVVKALDLSLDPTPDVNDLLKFDSIGFHLPMFHSVPAAVRVAGRIRSQPQRPKVFFFGLYADLFRRELLEHFGDYVLGTDWEEHIVSAANGRPHDDNVVQLGKRGFVRPHKYRAPARHVLPNLGHYAKLIDLDGEQLTSSVEATRGCAHHCTHCPIPPVYGGKVISIDEKIVLQDIDTLVEMGARHVSFVDPDFLNIPRHSLSVVRQMHERHPYLTYDFVAKVSHFRKHERALREMAPLGLRFVLTAMEFNDDEVLDVLKKKHDVADIDWSIALFRELGVHLKPTFVFVNPWVTVQDMMDLLDFVETRDLINAVDPIQYKIRLLLFNNSPLLDESGVAAVLGARGDFYTEWQHKDPEVEALHQEICRLVDESVARQDTTPDIFFAVKALVRSRLVTPLDRIGGRPVWLSQDTLGACPRFNVPNYCCTEPTSGLEELKGLL